MDISKGFRTRLSSLQRLVSNDDVDYPSAILLVPGLDGRNTKGSQIALKYLFEGACGKELLEGNLPDFMECLEEMVLLIQESSISVIYTHEMKKIILPWLENLGSTIFVEYLSSVEEEASIDTLQNRKCIDFKRMMLEAVPSGRGVGIPIPLGYDDVLDVESWPILQSFGLDSVFCPTGFLSERYTVVDVTEFLDILYRTIDPPCVHMAIETARQSVLPHALQSIALLDTASAEQRSRKTTDDIIGPLEMLFEFGELHCAEPADPNMRPVVLFDAETQSLGLPRPQLPRGWASRTVGSATHVTMEGCEPSTGMRWCRTYLLQRGRCLDFLRDYDALVDESLLSSEIAPDDDEDEGNGDVDDNEAMPSVFKTVHRIDKLRKSEPTQSAVSPEVSRVISRLEALYAKLWLSFRWAVKVAFASFTDVLEAGTFLQQTMDLLLKSGGGGRVAFPTGPEGELQYPAGLDLEAVGLVGQERLQVHMDCVNALGKVVTIDDVDDAGGCCWTYIRVSVHGISLDRADKGRVGCVAVGDTFLFSPASVQLVLLNEPLTQSSLFPGPSAVHTLGDAVCLTHAIPYYRSMIGPGIEEFSARRLLSSARSQHMLTALGLGKHIETSASAFSGLVTLTALTDHPLVPFASAELRPFSSGLLIEKLNTHCLPIMLSIGSHVECMWTVDLQEMLAQSAKLCNLGNLAAGSPYSIQSRNMPEGYVVIFKLKSFTREAVESEDRRRRQEALDEKARQGQELRKRLALRAAGMLADDDEDDADENMDDRNHPRCDATSALEEGLSTMQKALQFNPLQRSLPDLKGRAEGPRHVAFIVTTSSRGGAAMSAACSCWRAALRLHDLPEHRGQSAGASPLPEPILRSALCFLDSRTYEEENYTMDLAATSSMGDKDGLCIDADLALEISQNALSVQRSMTSPGLGLLGLQCVHVLSEAKRISKKSVRDNVGFSIQAEVSGDSDLEDWLMQSRSGSPQQLVVLSGHAGSCVSLIGAHIAERIERVVAMGDEYAGMTISTIHLDLASYPRASVAQNIVQAFKAATAANPLVARANVLIVTIVCGSPHHLPLSRMLSLLCACANDGSLVAAVAGVLVTSSVAESQPHGLGDEVWVAQALECCHVSNAIDLVIAIDSTQGEGFAKFRSWLGRANKAIVAARLVPTNLRIEESHLELLLIKLLPPNSSKFNAGSKSQSSVIQRSLHCSLTSFAPPLYGRSAKLSALYSSSRTTFQGSSTFPSVKLLRHVKIPPPPPHSIPTATAWSTANLLRILQYLFPQAQVSSAVTETWQPPPNTNQTSGIRRAIELATIKVMAARQRQFERTTFNKLLNEAVEVGRAGKRGAVALSGCIRSAHGIVTVADLCNSGSGMAVVEACAGSIVIRILPAGTVPIGNIDFLTLVGALTEHELDLTLSLFALCNHIRLQPKALLTRADLTQKLLLAMQEEDPEVRRRPLPPGWYCDGTSYWGAHGITNCGRELRPDIEDIANTYLERQNAQVCSYNTWLERLAKQI